MFVKPSVLACACLAAVLVVSSAGPDMQPTLKDRLDQILATFMGDPSAGVDIDMKHVLDLWRSLGPKPLETLSATEARKQPTPIEAAAMLVKREGRALDPFTVTTTDVTFPGPDGPMKARVYVPDGDAGGAPRPVVVFFHGGGFVLDNAMSTDVSSRAIAGTAGMIVVAPDYRLAPESKFPAAQEDAIAAYAWVLKNAARFGGDPKRVAIAGEGGGGMLAVDTSMAARDRKMPMPVAQILITPAAGIDMKTASYLQDAAARPWSEKAVLWAFGLFLSDPKQKYDPRIDMIGSGDMDGLPRTTIVTAEIDPLRSDGETYARLVQQTGTPVSYGCFAGQLHGFHMVGGLYPAAVAATEAIRGFVARYG